VWKIEIGVVFLWDTNSLDFGDKMFGIFSGAFEFDWVLLLSYLNLESSMVVKIFEMGV